MTTERDAMLRDVLEGLSRPQKELSPKYFYDTRGSRLFEEITRLAEYYPTRTERKLLKRWMPSWVEEFRPSALVELGAGSARKSRVVLDAMEAHATGNLYVPVDVSGEFLHDAAAQLRSEYTDLTVEPQVADISRPLSISTTLPTPTWFALLGSTIGNFDRVHAVHLLCGVRSLMGPDDLFLMGADLRPGPRKSVDRLEAAYDDARGITAAFNLNVLVVLNRELGADFDPRAYRHLAFYNAEEGRIEMHLQAKRPQSVSFPHGACVHVEASETIRTEISCKYDRPTVEGLFHAAGLVVERWVEDEDGLFALTLGRVGE